jgi:hypothetical protein
MSDWSSIQPVLAGVLFVTTAIATAGVGLMFGSLKTLRDTAEDLRNRVADLERERAEDKAAAAEMSSENALLRAMVTGKVEWVALTDQLEQHHREAIGHWTRTEATMSQILTAFREAP